MKKLFMILVLFPSLLFAGEPPPTLMEMAGVSAVPAPLSKSVLVVIDAQREYVDGVLPLVGIDQALEEGAKLLKRARAAKIPVVHVVHHGAGQLFNPNGPYFAVAAPLVPVSGEAVIEKKLPNAFAGTDLQRTLAATGRRHLVVVGFMTHLCLSSTVRAALDLGYATTVVSSVTATRDLPDGQGGTIPASAVQKASLAALADRFAVVVDKVKEVPE